MTEESLKLYDKTELGAVQDLVGGIPLQTIWAVYGSSGAGKSTLAAQMQLERACRHGHNVVVFDTELDLHGYHHYADIFSDRYGVDIGTVLVEPTVTIDNGIDVLWEEEKGSEGEVTQYVIREPNIGNILSLHGRGAKTDYGGSGTSEGETGKLQVKIMKGMIVGNVENIPVASFIRDHDVGGITYDSVSQPINEVPENQPSLPGRAKLFDLWLIQAQKIANAHENFSCIAIFHESANSTNPYFKDMKMKGGRGVLYATKIRTYIMSSRDNAKLPSHAPDIPKLPEDDRVILNGRKHGERRYDRFTRMTYTDKGLVTTED